MADQRAFGNTDKSPAEGWHSGPRQSPGGLAPRSATEPRRAALRAATEPRKWVPRSATKPRKWGHKSATKPRRWGHRSATKPRKHHVKLRRRLLTITSRDASRWKPWSTRLRMPFGPSRCSLSSWRRALGMLLTLLWKKEDTAADSYRQGRQKAEDYYGRDASRRKTIIGRDASRWQPWRTPWRMPCGPNRCSL